MTAPTPRRWFRFAFSLRTLFVVVTATCLIAAWVGYSLNWIKQRRAAIEDPNIFLLTEYQGEPPSPPWPLYFFGEEGEERISIGLPSMEDAEFQKKRFRALFPEASVECYQLPPPVPAPN